MRILPVELSATIFLALGVILAASLAVFGALSRRITVKRNELALREWAAEQGAVVVGQREQGSPPRLLTPLAPYRAEIVRRIESRRWLLAELSTAPPPEAKGKTPRWRVLSHELAGGGNWPATGLRPAAHAVSVLDLLSLSSFPSLAAGDRFVIFGCDAAAARGLAESAAQRLLPPDVGLVLHGSVLMLDFSTRSFDRVEFERMLDLANQLIAHLPRAPGPAAPVAGGVNKR